MIPDGATPYLIREAFRRFYPAYEKAHPDIPSEKRRAAECIMRCKTGELGYNISLCEDCGSLFIHAVSCNNRSCPCCQAALEKKWVQERRTELVEGIAYYHVIFTVPHELSPLIKANMALLLNLLFACVKETLLTLCADPKYMGAKPGILSVLHTWGQKLNFHPHIHVCLSGGGITPSGKFAETRHKGFLIPEPVIADMFRGKYLCALKKLYDAGKLELSGAPDLTDQERWKHYINRLFSKKWLPFVKETFNGKGNAIEYLARYSYRTAIANSRIVSVTDTSVSFRYKDYADGNAEKVMTVDGETFIGTFLQHVLPSRFNRVRYAGYLTNCAKSKNLKLIHRLRGTAYPGNPYRKMNTAELMMDLYGRDICSCPECSGKLLNFPRGRPLPMLPSLLMKLNFATS